MLIRYYVSAGIYPMIIIMILFMKWCNGIKYKKLFKLLLESIISYMAALVIYIKLIMKPIDSWVSNDVPDLEELVPVIINNYKTYFIDGY